MKGKKPGKSDRIVRTIANGGVKATDKRSQKDFDVIVKNEKNETILRFYDLDEMNREITALKQDGHTVTMLGYSMQKEKYIYQLRIMLNSDKLLSYLKLRNKNMERYNNRRLFSGKTK